MLTDLITTLQQNLALPKIYKMDRSSGKYHDPAGRSVQPDRFAQSIIPATIIALYAYSRTDEGALAILQAGPENNWAGYLFTDKKQTLTRRLASYSGEPLPGINEWINRIARETIRLVTDDVRDIPAVKQCFATLRNEALTYLPADLHLEELSVEGPVNDNESGAEALPGMMAAISASFSGTDTDEQKAN